MLCLLSHGQRFAFWTDEAKSLLEGTLGPVFRVPRQRAVTEKVPLHIQAVTDRTKGEKTLVDFIVHSQGAEQHVVVLCNYLLFSHLHVPITTDSEIHTTTLIGLSADMPSETPFDVQHI